jgi:hypothetical protein
LSAPNDRFTQTCTRCGTVTAYIPPPVDERIKERPLLLGLDLGQAGNPSALCIAEQASVDRVRHYAARHLHRWPLKTPYPQIVEDVGGMLAKVEKLNPRRVLCIDATGCGRPIADYFRRAKLPVTKFVAVIVTGGTETTVKDGYFHVPKIDLVGCAVSALENGRLAIAPKLKEAQQLARELRTFTAKVNIRTGHESFEAWREKDFDDLLFATCLCVWYGDRCQRQLNVWL